jgi:hypothetical protein
MKTKCFLFLTILFLSGFSGLLVANEPPGKIIDPSRFDAASQNKIKKSNVLIEKGNQIWAEANGLNAEIELLKSEFKFAKARKVERKRDRLYMQASNYYKDGHKGQYKILELELQESLKTRDSNEAREGLMDGESLFKNARKVRLSAQNRATDDETVKLYYDAAILEKQALDLMEGFFKSELAAGGSSDVVAENSDTKSHQEEVFVPVIQPPVPPATVIAAPVVVPPIVVPAAPAKDAVEPKLASNKEQPKVFFSIQILADRTKTDDAVVRKVYKGSQPIIHIEGDGWHRFMVGKFSSVADARKAMTSEGIKGFVVAYNGEKRIPVQEAVELLKKTM